LVMDSVFSRIGELKIIPVIKINRAEKAKELGSSLIEAGLPLGEITFRTDAAEAAIQALADFRGFAVGAGTVLSIQDARKAIAAGAQFIVSPGFNLKVAEYCLDQGIPLAPGVSTPTEIEAALGIGLKILKFFPAEAFGGIRTLKAIAEPYRMVRFIPTGGITADNLADYLRLPNVFACGGSWMVKSDYIDQGDFEKIVKLTREALDIVSRAFRNPSPAPRS
jgi:2-dehydro-3-deoxyphosphogluconate aldolase / (4S)-4-hydroxy-2-oxoglutarate aldolase